MASESEFSSAGSDHDDSDTIVISSKSRILISPRKKGSNAVSRLLGSTAADDVVEQILRGTTSSAEVVGRTKSSTVRIGNKEYSHEQSQEGSNGSAQRTQTTKTGATERSMRVNGSRQVSSSQATRTVRVTATRGAAANEEHGESGASSEELSAPSSEDEASDGDFDEAQRRNGGRSRNETTTQRTVRVSASKKSNENVVRRTNTHVQLEEAFDSHSRESSTHQTNERNGARRVNAPVHEEEVFDCHSDGLGSDSHSNASSSTEGSSHSHMEMHSRSTTQRKFDDQIRVSSQAKQATARTNRTKSTTRTQEAPATHVTHPSSQNGRRTRTVRHAEMSDLDDSIILPTTATQEMEDLKQTLKKLAHQDPGISGPSSGDGNNSTVKLSNPPKGKSASFRGATRGTEKLRREEYAAVSMDDGYTEAAWSTTAAIARFDEASSKKSYKAKSKSSRQSRPVSSDASSSESDQSEPSVARRLFSTPPPRSSKTSTPPTVPISSFTSKRTPSPLSTSFQSTGYASGLDTSLTAAASSSAQGSRAVLSALKALQDKIRRLEEEREKLLQELSDIKVKTRKREAEFASSEKKFAYELGQTKESARAAYDAIRSEKEELKLELVKYEERRKAMEAELKHAHKLGSTYSAKADDIQTQLQMCESQRKSLQAEVDATRGAHKQEVRDLRGELAALQKDKDTAQEQIKLLQQQFERESQNHAETRERLHETEQTIAGISQLNEKLVSKVWEANEIATKATKKTKKLQQSQRVSTLSRPTAASRAASISAANGASTPGRPGSAATKRGRVGSVTAKGAASTKKVTRASSNLELLRAANFGKDIPFVLGTSANRSHSIISNVQEAIRQCDTTYMTPVTNPPPTPTYLSTKKPKLKPRRASAAPSEQQDPRGRGASTTASILGLDVHEAGRTLVGVRSRESMLHQEPSNSGVTSSTMKRPSAIRVPTPSTSYPNPMKSQIMEDLHAAVENAEAEFTALNRKYKDAVKRVESGREGAGQLSASLGPMLDELESKGKQLNLLKQVYEQASHSTINPIRHIVHSPEAIQRKTASLRILNDYRQMEREAKSPQRSNATSGMPISPTGTNATATSRRASFFSDNE